MENFNTVPDKGTFGGSVEVINQNFSLAQQALEMLDQGAGIIKPYDPTKHSGLGRKTLKLKKDGSNVLMQTDFNTANTIYVIQYDFTLGEDITVPENCVLEFDGGSISAKGSNDTITGANTGINAGLVKIFDTNVILGGTWGIEGIFPEWFGAIGNAPIAYIEGITDMDAYLATLSDDILPIQKCIDFGVSRMIPTILSKHYYISSSIIYNRSFADAWRQEPYEIIGLNGGILFNGNYCFDTTLTGNVALSESLRLINIRFESPRHDKYILNCKLYRIYFEGCTINTLCYYSIWGYAQQIKLMNCYIAGYVAVDSNPAFITMKDGAHDILISHCHVENSFGCFFQTHAQSETQGVDFRITDTIIEGIQNAPAIKIGSRTVGTIDKCYFEGNKKGDIDGTMTGGSTNNLHVLNNTFDKNNAEEGDEVFHIVWWGALNAISSGNVGLDGEDGHKFMWHVPEAGAYFNDAGYKFNSYTVADALPVDNSGCYRLGEGIKVFNTSDNKMYIRISGTWKSVQLS